MKRAEHRLTRERAQRDAGRRGGATEPLEGGSDRGRGGARFEQRPGNLLERGFRRDQHPEGAGPVFEHVVADLGARSGHLRVEVGHPGESASHRAPENPARQRHRRDQKQRGRHEKKANPDARGPGRPTRQRLGAHGIQPRHRLAPQRIVGRGRAQEAFAGSDRLVPALLGGGQTGERPLGGRDPGATGLLQLRNQRTCLPARFRIGQTRGDAGDPVERDLAVAAGAIAAPRYACWRRQSPAGGRQAHQRFAPRIRRCDRARRATRRTSPGGRIRRAPGPPRPAGRPAAGGVPIPRANGRAERARDSSAARVPPPAGVDPLPSRRRRPNRPARRRRSPLTPAARPARSGPRPRPAAPPGRARV